MRPAVLTVVDGKNFILGTFDTTNFQDWWKSEPFPGAIETIQAPIHVYGQYHVCVVKMRNGTYSIYRTTNAGKSWESVYNTSDIIYTLTLIDYGWIVGSTSTGWIESKLDSGYTWSDLSSFAPGCKTVINIGDDILFAHDGSSVWRSYDYGETWSVVLRKSSWTSTGYHESVSSKNFKWDSLAYPALSGVGNTIFVGFGPYLNISEDLGETWFTHLQAWGSGWENWGGDQLFSPGFNTSILQLCMTDTSGLTLDDTVLMAKVLDYDTNTVYYAYSGNNYHFENKGTGFSWKVRFSLPFADIDHGKISSYDVLIPGSSEKDFLAIVCSYDSTNKPIVRYSSDSGWTWSQLDYSKVTVYEGDITQEITSGIGQQVFDEEYLTTATWVGAACHNTGKYVIEYNKTIRGLSWDQDLLVSFRKTKSIPFTYSTLVTQTLSKDFDVLNKKSNTITYGPDVLIKKLSTTRPYLHGILIRDSFESSYDMYLDLAGRLSSAYDFDILDKKQLTSHIFYDILLFDSPDKTYGMELSLIDDHLEQIMNSIERYSPQGPDIRYPDIPYVPYDSRTQNVTL